MRCALVRSELLGGKQLLSMNEFMKIEKEVGLFGSTAILLGEMQVS